MRVLEKNVDRTFVKGLKKLGLTSLKLTSFGPRGSAGWPDREVLLPGGAPAFVELKAPGKSPSDLQLRRFDELYDLNYHVGWFDDAERALVWIKHLMGDCGRG